MRAINIIHLPMTNMTILNEELKLSHNLKHAKNQYQNNKHITIQKMEQEKMSEVI